MSPHEDATGRGSSGMRSRFVLVCAPDGAGEVHPPESLRQALGARGAQVTIRTSAYDAMADLIEHERALRTRDQREAMVLLVVEPDRLPHAGDLVAAAAQYAPHAVCWRFAERDEPQLRAFTHLYETSDEADAQTPTIVPPTISMGPGISQIITPRSPGSQPTPMPRHIRPAPKLRLTGDAPGIAGDDEEGGKEPERPVLSEEELEILLSDDWEEQTREGGPA